MHKPGNNQEVRLQFTDTSTGTGLSDGVSLFKTDQHDLFLIVYESARMFFFTSNAVRMQILANGNVGIGTQSPNNIFQVGDGARLRISNGISDYSLIGTKDVDDANNTRIVISGNTRSGRSGDIEYVSTSTGNHIFYTSGSERMRINSSGNINVGTTTEYSTATKMHIKGASYGYSQPLVRIEQTSGWDGNYCLQTVGYSDLGGIRINGGDSGNSIFKTAATGDMGLTVNNGNILFNVNGAERMRINNSGRIGVANTNPQSMLHLGNCEVINSAPVIVFGKNVNNTGFRNSFMGYTDSFFFVIGDYCNTNAGANSLTSQLAIVYNAPASS